MSHGLSKLVRERPILRFRSRFDRVTGYGQHASYIVRSFQSFGYQVETLPYEADNPCEDVARTFVKKWSVPGNELLLATTDIQPCASQWMFSMYETTRLPKDRLENLRRARAIIVPCNWNAQCWNAQGLDLPIYVAPLGFNPDIFHPGNPPRYCVFGAGGNTSISVRSRKNLDTVIDAFLIAFPDQQDVRLHLKVLENCMLRTCNDPRVKVTRGTITEQEMGDWMRGLSVFVSASKAEAFNFFNIQAMATGLPLICCNFGGVQDYFSEAIGYPVSFTLGRPQGCYDELGLWAEPALESLVAQMRAVYENRREARRRGKEAANRARAFTWTAANRVLEKVLRDSGFWERAPSVAALSDEDAIVGFYRRARRVPKAEAPVDLPTHALSNTPRGLGDTVILTPLPYVGALQGLPRFIHCNPQEHRHFSALVARNPYYLPADDRPIVYADVLQRTVDMGNGHFIQRLQRAFGLEPVLKPKGYLQVPGQKIAGRVALHFEAGGPHSSWQRLHIHPRARQLYPESRAMIQEFIDAHPELKFFQLGTPTPFDNVTNLAQNTTEESIAFLQTCEWFIGIISGPMHLATALDVKCVVVINFPPASRIFLPTLVDIDQVESEWFYPQNVHLHQESDGPLVKRLSRSTLESAFEGKIYPYWSDRFLPLIHARL